MPSDAVILNAVKSPFNHLAAIGLAGVGLGATAGVYNYKNSNKQDPMSKAGESAQVSASALLWAGIIGGTAYAGSQASRLIPGKVSAVKKVSSVVSSGAKRFFKEPLKFSSGGKTALKVGGLATLAVLGGNYLLSNRPKEYEQDDQAEPIGSSVSQRMSSMSAGGDLVFGLHHGRH